MGGGLAVTLVLLVLATLLVILVVFVLRRRQKGNLLALEKYSNGGNAMDNPVYTGK